MAASSTTRTIFGAAAATTLGSLPVFLLSAQSVLVRDDLRFDERGLGLAVGAFFGAAAVGSVITGAVLETLGGRVRSVIAGGLATLSSTAVALSGSYSTLVLSLVLCGLAHSALQTSANLNLAYTIPHHHRGLGFGIKQSAPPAAILLGGLAVPTIGLAVGWRWAYVVTAGLALVVIVRGLAHPGWQVPRRLDGTRRQRGPAHGLLVIGAAVMLSSAAMTSMTAFLAFWSIEVGLSTAQAGYLLAAGSVLCILARVVGGYLADRRGGSGNLPIVAVQVATGAAGLLLISVGSVPTLLAGMALIFTIGWGWPGLVLFAVVRVGRERPGTATSAVQAGAFLGGAAGPILFGFVAHAASFAVAWWGSAGAMAVSSVLVLVARRIFLTDFARRPW